MAPLVVELLLRLLKPALAIVFAAVVLGVAVGPLGHPPTIELVLLAWLSGAALVMLIESGPI